MFPLNKNNTAMTLNPTNSKDPALVFGRVDVVHDWLVGMRGGERLLEALLAALPVARVHTLLYRPERISDVINRRSIYPSGLSRLPGVAGYYRWLLPLLPRAVERLRLDSARVVVTLSHCVAHGVRVPPGALHINYYLSPMRYLYDQMDAYRRSGRIAGWALALWAPRLRRWDRAAAGRADAVWAISRFVARRIEQAYGRPARVIYPPIRTDLFVPPPAGSARRDEDLLISAMVPYKNVHIAIEAANRLGRRLRVVGAGPLLGRMRRLAGPTVKIVGPVREKNLLRLYQTRRALIWPVEEDFGLVPLEAMACGMPVLGLRSGGLLETMQEGQTGAFFDQPAVDSLAEAWAAFDPAAYDPAACRAQAEKFGFEKFESEVLQALQAAFNERP
jgi:glycosyltransferase involved in cell wall biosynthesis